MLTVRKINHRCPQQRLAVPLLAAGVAVAVVRGHPAVPALPAQVQPETHHDNVLCVDKTDQH